MMQDSENEKGGSAEEEQHKAEQTSDADKEDGCAEKARPDESEGSRETVVCEEKNSTGDDGSSFVAGLGGLDKKIDVLDEKLQLLEEKFDEQILDNNDKQRIIDTLHTELQDFRNDRNGKLFNVFALDVIQVIDTIEKNCRIYSTGSDKTITTEERYGRLLRILTDTAEDLNDVLYRQNIEPYSVPGDEVDVHRQKIIQTVATDDPESDKKIALRIADGYEKDGKILRPERVKVFCYKAEDKKSV